MSSRNISELETPSLLLEQARMNHNIARMREQLTRLKVDFRPHVKTAKCIEAALAMSGGAPGPITVSTLRWHAGGDGGMGKNWRMVIPITDYAGHWLA